VDFVVVGFGLGAVMILVGMALRDLGPWLFGSGDPQQTLPEFETVKETIRKQTLASIGAGIATAGAGVAAVTFAALLAKIDDDLGTIVVGMSLALAAVGVGAWTYDSIRRYRAAMDVVLTQEESVMARIAPVPKRERAAIPQPITTTPDDDTPTETEHDDVIQVDQEPAVSHLDEPDADSDDSDEIENGAIEAIESPDDPGAGTSQEDDPRAESELEVVAVEHDPEDEESRTSEPLTTKSWFRNNSPDREVAPALTSNEVAKTEPVRRGPDPSSLPSMRDQAKSAPDDNERFTELPPFPEDGTDTLIEEAVRFDSRVTVERNVPSWLFDDLETDLATPGQPKQEDGIDQFRGSQTIQRRSALDRILAGENESGEDSDVSETDTAGDSTTPDRSRKPN